MRGMPMPPMVILTLYAASTLTGSKNCLTVKSLSIEKINSNKLARDRRRARQCRCIYKKQHKALSLSVSQNTRPAEIMPWA